MRMGFGLALSFGSATVALVASDLDPGSESQERER
jgi:hypothetical protein